MSVRIHTTERAARRTSPLGGRRASRRAVLFCEDANLPSTILCPRAQQPTNEQAIHVLSRGTLDRIEAMGYSVREEIGRGGMGVVYRAIDRRRGRVVALKTPFRRQADDLQRFAAEFRRMKPVRHPNLVRLYDLVCDRRVCFFTMEYVSGVEFTEYVGDLPPDWSLRKDLLCDALRQLAEAIAAMHAAGRLHRDVKPRNVLVTPAGRVKLLDYGLAADLDDRGLHANTDRHVQGTPAYMSPEQIAGRPVGPPSDWYSLGTMLYEALAGRLPYPAQSFAILEAKQDQDPPLPSNFAEGVPTDLEQLSMELLHRDPAHRPAAAEVLSQLKPSHLAEQAVFAEALT